MVQPAAQQQQQQNAAPTSDAGAPPAEANQKKILVQKYLTNCKSLYSCIYCRTHLANHDELVSRSFQGNRSRAYLFNSVINVSCGPAVQRELNTGSHAVADIFCANCSTTIGWKYEKAFVETQKYKEGKFIIELAHVVRENRHLEFDKRDMFLGLRTSTRTIDTSGNLNPKDQQQQQQQSRRRRPWRNNSLRDPSLSPTSSAGQSRWSSPSTSASSSNEDEMIYHANSNHVNDIDDDRNLDSNQADGCGGADDDEDEEFMFPLYDDLMCCNQSSYSSLSAITRLSHNKIRRSLYFESTPYDWKYSSSASPPTLSSNTQVPPTSSRPACISDEQQQSPGTNSNHDDEDQHKGLSEVNTCDKQQRTGAMTLGFSLCSSADISPSTSSSMSAVSSSGNSSSPSDSSGLGKASGADEDAAAAVAATGSRSERNLPASRYCDNRNKLPRSDYETQFDCDVDDPAPASNGDNNNQIKQLSPKTTTADSPPANHIKQQRAAGSLVGESEEVGGGGNRGNISRRSIPSCSSGDSKTFDSAATTKSPMGSRSNSLSLDDEEFYDCNTEHDVQQFQ